MGDVQFRAAKVGDARAILTVKQEAITAIESDEYSERQLAAWCPEDELVEDFGRAIETNRFEILLATMGPSVVAYGVLNTERNRIDAIFVHPEYWGKGIGSSLVRQFEARARIKALPELKIVSSLNASGFYEEMGYFDFGRKQRTINGVELEFAIMRKVFETE